MYDVQLLFETLADLTFEQRDSWYREHHIAADIRAEVEALLQFDAAPSVPLNHSIGAVARELLDTHSEPRSGDRCGAYQLVRLLGRGGMGSVFLAVRSDGEVDQRAAIKFARDLTDDPAARDRFLRERQFLASLNHPGIARLLDAGHTAEGRPYLVMEYVEGKPLDLFAENLGLRGKLELFLRVCAPLAYAHRNLVIHRDLKPSNILVNAAGEPKLLDFGIARLLDDNAQSAFTRDRALTLEYASPEQLLGAARTTATDVYSLGAVLYRLLIGRSPHAPNGDTETMEACILHREAPPPSRIDPSIPRDLDFILAKALRKEPEDRYPVVDAFAADVRAFLDSRPVAARAGDPWYRARKFVRRRWVPLAAAAVLMLLLTAGHLAVSRERAIAQRRFQQLRHLAGRVLQFDMPVRQLPGAIAARREIVAVSMEYFDGLSRESHNDPELAGDLANGYLQLANVQGVPAYPNLGQFADAEASLAKAERFSAVAVKANPASADAIFTSAEIAQSRMMLADSQRRDADILKYAGDTGHRLESLVQHSAKQPDKIRNAVPMWYNTAQAYMNQHRFDDALRYVRQGVTLSRTYSAPAFHLAAGLSLLANILRQTGDLDGALATIAESRKTAETAVYPGEVQRASMLYTILWRQSQILWSADSVSLNRRDDALEPARTAFELIDGLAARDPNDATTRGRSATAAQQLGDVLQGSDPRASLAAYDAGIAREREIAKSPRARAGEARLLALSVEPLLASGRRAEAGSRIGAAFALLRNSGDYPAHQIRLGSELEDVYLARATYDGSGRSYGELLDGVLASKPHTDTDLMLAARFSRILAHGRRSSAQQRIELWRGWQARMPRNPFIERELAAAEKSH